MRINLYIIPDSRTVCYQAEEYGWSDAYHGVYFLVQPNIKKSSGINKHPHIPVTRHGCGDGLLLEICQQAGIECDGFEISDSLVRKLRSRFGKETIHNGNLEMLPEKTYDIVFLINVIEHLTDPVITLAQIYRILKPGGITFIHAPLAHLYYFNDRTIEGILRKSGFQPDGNFYLTSKSVLKKTAQQILSFLDIRLDNGLGVIARLP